MKTKIVSHWYENYTEQYKYPNVFELFLHKNMKMVNKNVFLLTIPGLHTFQIPHSQMKNQRTV